MIRVAAVGDVHVGTDCEGQLAAQLADVGQRADVLALAGDLTRIGGVDEAKALVHELRDVPIPIVAVLGNHDYHYGHARRIRAMLERADVRVLEGEATTLGVAGATVGIAGIKGFGGGFQGACASAFGEPEMKAFVEHAQIAAGRLSEALSSVRADVRLVLLHYSPVEATLVGERLEIYPFLGSYLLAEPIDTIGADLVLHGHAHSGTEHGATPQGIPVRNVAQHVLGRAYALYDLEPAAAVAGESAGRISRS